VSKPKKRGAGKAPKPIKGAVPSHEEIAAILEAAGAQRRGYRAKTNLFSQGSASDTIYYITSGKVQITVVSKQGKEGTIALLSKGDFVGEGCLTLQPLYLDSAVTTEDCEILTLAAKKMRTELHHNTVLAEYFTNFLLKRTLDVQADLVDHLFNSSEKRLARILLLLANFGHTGKLEPIPNVTQELLAQRVGTTRARISFFMNKFRRLGLIEYNGKIKVHSGLLNVVLNDSRLTPQGTADAVLKPVRGGGGARRQV